MFELAQRSELGVQLGPQLVLSAVCQADDAVIMSKILILSLVIDYCTKYDIQLFSSKTKLIEILPPKINDKALYNPVPVNGCMIEFVEQENI